MSFSKMFDALNLKVSTIEQQRLLALATLSDTYFHTLLIALIVAPSLYVDIHVCIWVNFITTSLFSLTIIIVNRGNDPQMAARFRLVKSYNLPRCMYT